MRSNREPHPAFSWRATRSAELASGAAVSFVLACGGAQRSTGEGDDGPASLGACEESARLEKVMIADFESGPVEGSSTGSDGTPGAELFPVPPGSPPPTPLDQPRCGQMGEALHVVANGLTGYGYTVSFGALGRLNPGGTPGEYFDAADWDGVSLWVRKGTETSGSSVFLGLGDVYTAPLAPGLYDESDRDRLLPDGNYCAYDALDVDGDGVPDPTRSQCDRYGAGIGIAVEWRFFKIPFNRMSQRAYGRPSPLPEPDPRVLGFDIGLDGVEWDFWMDDFAFYREPRDAAAPANGE